MGKRGTMPIFCVNVVSSEKKGFAGVVWGVVICEVVRVEAGHQGSALASVHTAFYWMVTSEVMGPGDAIPCCTTCSQRWRSVMAEAGRVSGP